MGKPTASDVDSISKALMAVLKRGMPMGYDDAPEVLIDLLGVVARSIHPDERMSRIDTANRMVAGTIEQIAEERHRRAMRAVFMLDATTRSLNLTKRWERAATAAGYSYDHYRKLKGPQVVRDEIALPLHLDSLRYKSRARRAPAALEPTGDTPKLTIDDLTAQEEHVSRIWAEVYSLRAELIAAGRKDGEPGYGHQVEEHRLQARVHESRLQELVKDYVDAYGDRYIRHGENEYDAEGLQRLVAWELES